jgi:hypothetical protein
MSELKAISGHEIREDIDYNTRGIDPENKEWCNYGKELCDTLYYRKSEADEAIDELKAKLENVQESMYADVVDANMENRRLKRALWIARAERARDKALIFYFAMTESCKLNIDGYSNKEKGHIRMRPARWWRITWLKVERKCRAKMEEYK